MIKSFLLAIVAAIAALPSLVGIAPRHAPERAVSSAIERKEAARPASSSPQLPALPQRGPAAVRISPPPQLPRDSRAIRDALGQGEKDAPASARQDKGTPGAPAAAAPIPAPATSVVLKAAEPQQAATSTAQTPPRPVLAPLDEGKIMRAVVKIQCSSADRKGRYTGSGFVLPGGRTVATAAHLMTDTSGDPCQVIFPRDRAPSIYLWATPENLDVIKKRYDEQGIDVAFLALKPTSEYPDAAVVFSDAYPSVPYPVCREPDILGDRMLHYGYPGNYADHSYLAREEGQAVEYADIAGIEQKLSQDQSRVYKSPVFSYTMDQSMTHPYLVSRLPSFYGASGGLVLDATRRCIAGVGHGGTIGGGAGENYSVSFMLGWEGAPGITP